MKIELVEHQVAFQHESPLWKMFMDEDNMHAYCCLSSWILRIVDVTRVSNKNSFFQPKLIKSLIRVNLLLEIVHDLNGTDVMFYTTIMRDDSIMSSNC